MEDFRVIITERCNANCPTCFNSNIRVGHEMSADEFENLCEYLSGEGGIKRIKIMGGEPTVHPDFLRIIECAQKYFYSVHIFTNAINDEILKLNLREQDSIIYNVSCLPVNFRVDKLLIDKQGYRLFETQLGSNFDAERIKHILLRAKKHLPKDKMAIALTLNCVENIFVNREKIISLWNEISSFIHTELGMEYHIDHNIPYCFFVGSKMDIKLKNSLCKINCAGLITAKMQLQYCNQSQDILCNLMTNGKFIPFSILENRLQEYYHKKMSYNLNKICKDCVLFSKKCNGGCFMHKDIITKKSIIQFSDCPFMDE